MGILSSCPCLNRDPIEIEIVKKENLMKIDSFTCTEIKEAFFYLNEKESLSYINAMKGLKNLTSTNPKIDELYNDESSEARKVLQLTKIIFKYFNAILKGVILGNPKDKLEDNEFSFKQLMIQLMMMSMINSERIPSILKLEGKENLNEQAIQDALLDIFKTVGKCSLQLILIDCEDPVKRLIQERKYKLYLNNVIHFYKHFFRLMDESKQKKFLKKFYKMIKSYLHQNQD